MTAEYSDADMEIVRLIRRKSTVDAKQRRLCLTTDYEEGEVEDEYVDPDYQNTIKGDR